MFCRYVEETGHWDVYNWKRSFCWWTNCSSSQGSSNTGVDTWGRCALYLAPTLIVYSTEKSNAYFFSWNKAVCEDLLGIRHNRPTWGSGATSDWDINSYSVSGLRSWMVVNVFFRIFLVLAIIIHNEALIQSLIEISAAILSWLPEDCTIASSICRFGHLQLDDGFNNLIWLN